MTTAGPFEDLTDELYASPPARFVARRDELVREARGGGDRELAGRIGALRRPTVGAWYLNTAARSGLTSLRELLHLGRDLRDAQARGDVAALRELAARRTPLVGRVVRDVTAHLATLGTPTTPAGLDEVRGTLAGALADPEAAELVARGRLDGPRAYAGFGGIPFPAAPAGPAPAVESVAPVSPTTPAASSDRGRARAAQAAQAAQAARRELAAAEADLAADATRRHAAEDAVARARADVEEQAERLARSESARATAEELLAAASRSESLAAARRDAARRAAGGTDGSGPG